MKLIKIIIILAIVIFPAWAMSDYKELKDDFDAYRPPSYFTQLLSEPDPEFKSVLKQDTKEFSAMKSKIIKMKSSWADKIKAQKHEFDFVKIDKSYLKKLGPAKIYSGFAADKLKNNFSLKSLEHLTLLRNPAIKAAEKRFKATIESYTQVTDLDEVLRSYSGFTKSLMTGVGPQKGKDSMKIKFPFPAVMSLKGQIVTRQAVIANQNLAITARNEITKMRKNFWNLMFVYRAKNITAETLRLFKRLEQVANARYKSGKTSFQDVIKINIKTHILEEDLVTLKEKQKSYEATIKAILNIPQEKKIGKPVMQRPVAKIPSIEKLRALAKNHRQEIKKIKASIAKMEKMTELSETMILPPFTLSLSVYENDIANTGGPGAIKPSFPVTTTASMGAGLPKNIWFGTGDSWLKQTRQKIEALKSDLEKTYSLTDSMVENGWFELDKAVRETNLYENKVVELSKSALDVSSRGYESGTVTFADVINSYTTWLNVRLSLAKKFSAMGIARANLINTLGVLF